MESYTSLKNKRRVSKFTTKMVLSTIFCCGFMVMVISNLYSQSYNQCVHDFSFRESSTINNPQDKSSVNSPSAMNRCNRDNQQITWLSWLVSKPASIEFHFLDLVELLSRK